MCINRIMSVPLAYVVIQKKLMYVKFSNAQYFMCIHVICEYEETHSHLFITCLLKDVVFNTVYILSGFHVQNRFSEV